METNKDPFIGITGTDRRGICWRVARKLKPDTVLVRHQTYVIEFDNGTSKEYSGQHLQGCALGTTKNWGMITSKVSAEEYVGKEYPTKDGHVVKILRVTKNRPAYDRSLVEIEWDGNPDKKCVIDLHKIIGTAGAKQLTMDERLFQGPRELTKTEILTNSLSRGSTNGSYCKLPDGMDVYYAVTGTLKRHEHIMSRCYNPNDKDYYNYGGKGVTVADEWLNIYNFARWMEKYYVVGWEIDKDLLAQSNPGNKTYGPDTCLMIPGELNISLRSTPNNLLSDLPLCVYHSRNKGGKDYMARAEILKTPMGSKYDTIEECFAHVKILKEHAVFKQAICIVENTEGLDPEYVKRLMNAIEKYEVLDMRDPKAPNYLTRETIINHMIEYVGLDKDAGKKMSYAALKAKYIEKHPKLKEFIAKIDEILNNEYGEE